MTPELEAVLASAYHRDQVGHDTNGAVRALCAAMKADEGIAREMADEKNRLAAVVPAREVNGQHGDHVSAVLLALLNKAFDGEQP